MSETLRRLFIGLMPDEGVRAALAAHQQLWHWGRGRLTSAARLHLTLHFIGEIDATREAALRQALTGVEVDSFSLVLRTTEVWSGRTAVLRADDQPALSDLHALLAARMLQAGLAPRRDAFAPHVTLARDAPNAVPPERLPRIAWAVRDCALVWSHAGRYDIVERYGGDQRALSPAAARRTLRR